MADVNLSTSYHSLCANFIKNINRYFAPAYYFYLSVAFTLAIFFLNSSWMFNRYGWLDHFAYLGAAFYFPQTTRLFPHHPIIELLPTYIPEAFFYKALPPATANIFRDILYLTLSLFMFMRICFFLTKDTIATIITTVIIGTYYYFLASIGSDYTDSTIQILCIAHLYIITKLFDYKDGLNNIKKSFLCLGALSSIMFSSGVLSIVYVVNFGLFIAIFSFLNASFDKFNFKTILQALLFWTIGFIAIVIIFSLYLKLIDHDYYMKQNLLKLFGYLGGIYQAPNLSEWLPNSGWLILPCSIFLASVIFLFQKISLVHFIISERYLKDIAQNNSYLFSAPAKAALNIIKHDGLSPKIADLELAARQFSFIIFLIATSASLIFIQLIVKQWSLQFMYFSQINFIYFLGLAILLSKGLTTLSSSSKSILILLTSSTAAFNLNFTTSHIVSFEDVMRFFPTPFGSIAPWLILTLSLTGLFSLYARKIISALVVCLAVLFINLFSYSQNYGGFCCLDAYPLKFFGSPGTVSQNVFNDTIKLSLFLDELDKNREKDIWFDDKELLGQVYRQVYSMNYFNQPKTIINKALPQLGDYSGPMGSEGHAPNKDHKIILISESLDKLEKAVENLATLFDQRIDYETHKIKIGEVEIFTYITK